MKKVFIFICAISVFNVFAESKSAKQDEDEMTSMEMLKMDKEIKVDKEEIRKSLQILKAKGQLSESDYLKALNDLNGMDDKKMEDINKKAQEMIKANPNAAEAASKKNLSTP